MLRASAEHNHTEVDLRGVTHLSIDPRVAGGRALVAFTRALVIQEGSLHEARETLASQLGAAAAARAAAVAGNFEMMNRLVDAAALPITKSGWAQAAPLGLDEADIRARIPHGR